MLALLEEQSKQGHIDLFYGDETHICEQGYIPYAWQFREENLAIGVQRGKSVNVFGLFSRQNDFYYRIVEKNINAEFMVEILDEFSWQLKRNTVIVLDNASIHKAKKVRKHFELWQSRGLYIFFLPEYSPQLNLIERLWKELKYRWLKPSDYLSTDNLFYAVNRICANIGECLFLHCNN